MPFLNYLFDLDGTLIDSIDLIFRAYRHTAERHLAVAPPDAIWLAGLGTPLRTQLAEVTDDPELIEKMVVTYRAYHQEHHDGSIRLYPEIAEVLKVLFERGARLGIVTSKLRPGAERGLAATGIAERFHVLVSADEVKRAKPDPEPVERALEKLGADGETTVFIGDSPHDIAAGRAAGVRTAAALWGPFHNEELAKAGPDYLLGTPSEILSL